MSGIEEIRQALEAAEQFIVNGVELGYIRMPDAGTPDSAHQTLPMIRQAQATLASLRLENEELKSRAIGKEIVAWRYRHIPTVDWSYSATKHPRKDLEQEPLRVAL